MGFTQKYELRFPLRIKMNSKAINKLDCAVNLTSFKNFSQQEMKNYSRLYAHLGVL